MELTEVVVVGRKAGGIKTNPPFFAGFLPPRPVFLAPSWMRRKA